MSLLLLIDGYNVVAPIAAPRRDRFSRDIDPNWLHQERMLLIKRLITHLGEKIRERTCVVFDAANPPKDRPSEFSIDHIDIRFAVDYPEADDLIEELIKLHTSPKTLTVVSSDHRIQAAASKRGATCLDAQPWLDALLDGNPKLIHQPSGEGQRSREEPSKPDVDMTKQDVDDWMQEFGFGD